MTEPGIDYSLRTGNQPRPDDWLEPASPLFAFAHTRDEGALYAATGQTFWADISEFQTVVNSEYPYPVLGFRVDTGNRTDNNAAANWSYCDTHDGHIRVVIPYVVFKPGQSSAIFARLKNLFGSQCPPQVVPEIDMESGSDFAGPGNHSSEANLFVTELAAWAGEQKQTQGYANSPDWQACWPTPPAWMKRRLANYSSTPLIPGYYSVQYYGALPYPSPPGWPRTCAPFGSYVDMNMTPRTIDQILVDYGVTAVPEVDMTPEEHAMLQTVVNMSKTCVNIAKTGRADGDTKEWPYPFTPMAAALRKLDQISAAVTALGTGPGGTVSKADVLAIINATKLQTGD